LSRREERILLKDAELTDAWVGAGSCAKLQLVNALR
jgi:hypothetical protein